MPKKAVTQLPTTLLTEIWPIYELLFKNLHIKEISSKFSTHIGEYLEKYIQSQMANEFYEQTKDVLYKTLSEKTRQKMINIQRVNQIPSNQIHLAQIDLPKLYDVESIEFNKEIKYKGLHAEYDILLKKKDGSVVILDIKCMSSNGYKYCWQQQCVYAYIYYKTYGIIPISQLYYVYAQRIVEFQLTEEKMAIIEQKLKDYKKQNRRQKKTD